MIEDPNPIKEASRLKNVIELFHLFYCGILQFNLRPL